ncbi:hypothetical protein ElyMa_006875300 [Elysia marginata]|uniref:Uncharacterized protein n=1 Tax=Elysia marginata TaxID=1093978 RepID=A0AAV4JDH5_9GAST|nr:hypothetical protein ElyMa_006875300 [Elysia marginata]
MAPTDTKLSRIIMIYSYCMPTRPLETEELQAGGYDIMTSPRARTQDSGCSVTYPSFISLGREGPRPSPITLPGHSADLP